MKVQTMSRVKEMGPAFGYRAMRHEKVAPTFRPVDPVDEAADVKQAKDDGDENASEGLSTKEVRAPGWKAVQKSTLSVDPFGLGLKTAPASASPQQQPTQSPARLHTIASKRGLVLGGAKRDASSKKQLSQTGESWSDSSDDDECRREPTADEPSAPELAPTRGPALLTSVGGSTPLAETFGIEQLVFTTGAPAAIHFSYFRRISDDTAVAHDALPRPQSTAPHWRMIQFTTRARLFIKKISRRVLTVNAETCPTLPSESIQLSAFAERALKKNKSALRPACRRNLPPPRGIAETADPAVAATPSAFFFSASRRMPTANRRGLDRVGG